MSSLAIRQKVVEAEQRRAPRLAVEIPVILRTVSGNRPCRMANISDLGAKLELPSPPAEGISACILCGDDELYCRVIWSNQDSCGVEFERALPAGKLTDIAGERQDDTGPVANMDKIRMGRKRGGLVSGG